LVFIFVLQSNVSRIEAEKKGTVLILGSGGLVGRALTKRMAEEGFEILHVRNREHIDLRVSGALDEFNATHIDYCFFLACEVGGSKFIESAEQDTQLGIIESNLRIYQTVLPYLAHRRIPFVFTSSYLQGTENSYGVVKRLGEVWVHTLGGLGRVLRLWNVYGAEAIGAKSHVLSDWAHKCVTAGAIASLTDGREERQFVHVDDVAGALRESMRRHSTLDMVSDVSTGGWVDMRSVAAALAAASDNTCTVTFTHTVAAYRARLSPDMKTTLHKHWKPTVSLLQGCRMLLDEYWEKLGCDSKEATCKGGRKEQLDVQSEL